MKPTEPIDPPASAKHAELRILCPEGGCPHTPSHLPLPVLFLFDEQGTCVTRWTFDDEERAAIANGADIYLHIQAQGQRVVPMRVSTKSPREDS